MLTSVLTQMTCVRSLFTERYYRTVFSDNKRSRLEKANSYTQKHKHKYFNFQLAVRVISLTYTSRKLDKVIFWHSKIAKHTTTQCKLCLPSPKGGLTVFVQWAFSPSLPSHFLGNNSWRETKHGDSEGDGKHLIWEKNHELLVLK